MSFNTMNFTQMINDASHYDRIALGFRNNTTNQQVNVWAALGHITIGRVEQARSLSWPFCSGQL